MMARHLQKAQLNLQSLEARLVPSTVTTVYSSNWSGYAVTAANDSVSYVAGSWTVPSVSGKGTSYSASWVGIDGYSSSSVEQIGTDSDIQNGKATYYAWYEMYPSAPVEISSITVKAGDQITASVSYSSGSFTLKLTDGTQTAFSISKSDSTADRSSAEWIEEAPASSRSILPLSDFGTVTFSSASATINSTTGSISAGFSGTTQIDQIDMETKSGTLKDSTSSLNSSGSGFSVTWDSSGSGGGSGGKGSPTRATDSADPVAFSINLSNPIVNNVASQSSTSATSWSIPTASSSNWIPVAMVRPTYYTSADSSDAPAALNQDRSSDTIGSPAIRDIWLGKPIHGELPETPVKTDDILGNGVIDRYLAGGTQGVRTGDDHVESLGTSTEHEDSNVAAVGGFLGMVFVGTSLKPKAKKNSSRQIGSEE